MDELSNEVKIDSAIELETLELVLLIRISNFYTHNSVP
jgi:hypothetical protein